MDGVEEALMGEGATLFRVFGIPVRVHVSWLVILGLLTWSLAVGYFPQVLPGIPLAAHWAQGLLAALLLFASVLLHELSHSVVARRHGIPVSGITLHIFGGVSQLERPVNGPGPMVGATEPRRKRDPPSGHGPSPARV